MVNITKYLRNAHQDYNEVLHHTSQNAAAAAKSLQLCLTLCNSIDGSPPGSPIPGILQARTLEWVAISFSNVLKSLSRVQLFATPGLQPTRPLCPWIFQARVLEWGAIAFSDQNGQHQKMYKCWRGCGEKGIHLPFLTCMFNTINSL